VWYTQRADFRGMMACVLGHGTANLPEEFSVYGMSNLLYRSPALDVPQLRLMSAHFAPYGDIARVWLEAVGEFPPFTADRAMCLPLQITLANERIVDVDLKAAVMVYNDLGWEVARADGVFATANQRTSSQALPGETMTAYPLLRLPYGAPPGDYTVRLRIYDEVENIPGYNVLPIGAPAGKDLLLGTWSVLPGADWTQVRRSPDLSVTTNLSVGDHPTLVAHNAIPSTLVNGSDLRLAFLWDGMGPLPDIALVAEDESWRVDVPARDAQGRSDVTLDWRQVRVPPDVQGGTAELRLDDGTVLAYYQIEVLPAHYEEPEFDRPVGVTLPGVGTLVGYTLDGDTLDRSQPVSLRLVWRADDATHISYTVFAQLIGQGQVIAQSDAIPAQGRRPTTGWRPGEYIADKHQLVFHEDALPGEVRLIVGMYDASTGERIALPSGLTAIIVAEGLIVR